MANNSGFQGWKEFIKLEFTQMISQAKGKTLSRDFFELVKNIGEAKSKQEEDFLMRHECKKLQDELKEPDSKKLKEYLIRLMYCEMFGFKSEFGYIHAINLTQGSDLVSKRVGYLACCTFLNPQHELLLLVINSVQKDLRKDNILEVCAGLTTICKLMNKELIPPVEQLVINLLEHRRPLVRKKAVMALHRFIIIDPTMLERYEQKIRSVLCDQDPSVMSATLCIFEDAVLRSAKEHKDLIPSFVSILKQIIEGRLPKEYNYHRVPAPWIQIKILRILASLGANDRKSSEHMFTSLFDCMKRADTGINAGYAVVYECVRTISAIYPNTGLLDAAANSVARFLTSNNHNLRYLGITALSGIVSVNPKYAAEHQMIVINCLEDHDETLKRKTLDLLYKMTNPKNVVFIVAKLIKHLRATTDAFLRQELVLRITELAERFSPDNEWFIKTLNTVFLVAGDLVAPSVAHNLMQLIAIGPGDDDAVNDDLRRYAVTAYAKLLERKVLRDLLTQVVCWVLGEFGHMGNLSLEDLVDKMCELLERQYEQPETRSVILSAMLKLCARVGGGFYPPAVQEAVEKYQSSFTVDTQQRCYEFARLVADPPLLQDVLPADAFDEDLQVDKKLRFLDSFVDSAVANGAKRYVATAARTLATPSERVRTLQFEAYERPTTTSDLAGAAFRTAQSENPAAVDVAGPPTLAPMATTLPSGDGLFGTKVETKWTEEGFVPELRAAQIQQQKPPAPTASSSGSGSGSGSSTAAKRNSAREKLDEERTEKQKEAAALFQFDGGDEPKKSGEKKGHKKKTKKASSSSSSSSKHGEDKPKRERKTRGCDAAAPAAGGEAPSSGSGGGIDLFGMGTGSAPASATPSPAPVPPKSGGGSLLDLDGLFGGGGGGAPIAAQSAPAYGAPSQSPVPAQQQQQQFSGGLGALFGDMPASSGPAPSLAPSILSPRTPEPSGSGGGVMLAPSRSAHFPSWPAVGGLGNLAALPLALELHQAVEGQPKSAGGQVQTLSDDANAHVGFLKVYRPDATLALVYVSNKTDGALSDVKVELKIPDAFAVTFVSDPGVVGVPDSGFQIASLPAQCTVICQIRLQWRKHAVNLASPGSLRFFTEKKEPRGTAFTLPLGIQDVMRATAVADFGAVWGTLSQEKKAVVPQSKVGASAATLADALKALLNFNVVHASGVEVRAAAVLAGTDKVILITCAAGLSLNLTVRSNDTFLSDIVLKACRALLV